ncbi:O-antigen ligase family protein [Congregibacter sp.]|nr:O-antigen ligase family protein [Congregibacter sp.]MDA8962016.1 O-antigen ligase family protein [Congregibacter sp.]
MVKIFTILALLGSTFLLFSSPWVAGLSYATVSIVQPQYVWFWAFDNIPVFRISAGLSIVAWLIKVAKGDIVASLYKEPIVWSVALLWVIFQLSQFASPYPEYTTGASTKVILNTLDIVVLMFLILVGLLDNRKALFYLVVVLVLATLYYTWWSNYAYLTGDWSKFSRGRLNGPFQSPYRDGNVFSILFVIGMPFLIFGVIYVRQLWAKAILLAAIPLVWHAVVLCASRGALLSMAATTAAAALMIRSKSLNVLMFVSLAAFLVYQGGALTQRSMDTVDAADQNKEQPINPRILSWQVGWDMVKAFPIFGVGPQRFKIASETLYPGKSPHVAHNTFLNFSANTGIFAGLIYLFFFRRSYQIYKLNKAMLKPDDRQATFINNAGSCALVGYFVGALFLDLIVFEPFYFTLILILLNHHILLREQSENAST